MTTVPTAIAALSPVHHWKTNGSAGSGTESDTGSGTHCTMFVDGSLTVQNHTDDTQLVSYIEFGQEASTGSAGAPPNVTTTETYICFVKVYSDTISSGYGAKILWAEFTGTERVIELDAAGKPSLTVDGTTVTGSSALSTGWHMLCAYVTTTSIRLRVDGVDVGSSSASPSAHSGAFDWHWHSTGTIRAHVGMSNVAYWTSALTDSQTDNIYTTYAGSGSVAASGTGSLTLGSTGSVAIPGTASLVLSASGTAVAVPITHVTVDSTGSGSTTYATDSYVSDPDFRIAVLDSELIRAPTSITVVADGGIPGDEIRFYLDGVSGPELAYTTNLDTSGALNPTSITITGALGGQVGTRTITAEQDGVSGIISDSETYTMAREPINTPIIQGPDAHPVEIPGAVIDGVRHWVLQDLLGEEDGGIGSYIMPINPREMSSPHYENPLKTHHTTAKATGMFHVFEAGQIPKEWTFSGVAPDQAMVDKLLEYGALNRRFYVIDHRNRAWKTVWTNVEIIPRLRTNYNGTETDWFTDYTVTTVIMDQDWLAPE